MTRAFHRLLAASAVFALIAGCEEVPRDSHGTLERVRRSGELRVGVTHDPPWATLDGGRVAGGIEPAIVERFAASLGVRPRYVTGAESELMEALHAGKLDVVAAGLDKTTAHKKRGALTQPYLKTTLGSVPEGEKAAPKQRVLAVSQGESRLLYTLDRFLLARKPQWRALARAEARP
ncbi:MAG TPA: transporter substrate-binding domain-containing protein [Caulobacteraceae bacterium]